MNLRSVLRVLGFLLLIVAGSLLLPCGVALAAAEPGWWAYLAAAGAGAGLGALLMRCCRGAPEPRAREGFAIVTLGWLAAGLLGALPLSLSGAIPGFTDACFEAISGFTTTGATVVPVVEELPRAALFWRALTHWLGGMGIVVLVLAVLPLLGVGGMQLFRAEVPGPVPDRLTPRIRETARRLWGVYVLLTATETLLLMLCGVSFFESVCHAFATMATGGFSTRTASIAAFASPPVEWIVVLFMFLAGANFTLHYLALVGRPAAYFRDEEFRFYLRLFMGASVALAAAGLLAGAFPSYGAAARASVFQVVSIGTTTGFVTMDYTIWPPLAHAVLLLLMVLGGCAGSTAGGIKVMRALLLLKLAKIELKKLIHPRAVYNVWLSGRTVAPSLATNVLGFFLLYMLAFLAGVLGLAAGGRDLVTALGASAATLGNVGPGLGLVGPASHYAMLAGWEKWLLAMLMIVGRLEIYTVLVLLMPGIWRRV